MNLRLHYLIAIVAIATTACATKHYPIATPMSSAEASLMTCKSLEIELIRADQVERKINKTGEFSAKTALGFLGDFGIGNGMAKSEARDALADRRRTIHEAQLKQGCMNYSHRENQSMDR